MKEMNWLLLKRMMIYGSALNLLQLFLNYSNQRKAIIDHVDSEDKCPLNEIKIRSNESLPLNWNTQNTIYINESGLYSLILRSDMDKAKKIQTLDY